MNALLECKDIVLCFDGRNILDRACFTVDPGELHVVLGKNGAGKTMLMNCISGMTKYNCGDILFNGKKVGFRNFIEARKIGIYMIANRISLLPNLSVKENLFFKNWHKKNGLIDWKSQNELAESLFREFDIPIDLSTEVGKLGMAEQRIVEIVKAITWNAKLLIIDEAFAEFTDSEMQKIMGFLLKLKDKNCSIIIVTQQYWKIYNLADKLSVMNDGHIETTVANSKSFSDIIVQYTSSKKINKPLFILEPKKEIIFEARNLADEYSITEASFCVRRGEILGVTGKMGSGRTCLAKLISGVNPLRNGEIFFQGRKISPGTHFEFRKAGISYLPEDDSLAIDNMFDIGKNITLGNLEKFTRNGFIDLTYEEDTSEDFCRRLGLQYIGKSVKPERLSAGERKKILWGKNMMSSPKLFVLDEPMKNLDSASKVDIFNFLYTLAMKGRSAVFLSSDYEDLIRICSSVLILRDGVIIKELKGRDINKVNIRHYIYGELDYSPKA